MKHPDANYNEDFDKIIHESEKQQEGNKLNLITSKQRKSLAADQSEFMKKLSNDVPGMKRTFTSIGHEEEKKDNIQSAFARQPNKKKSNRELPKTVTQTSNKQLVALRRKSLLKDQKSINSKFGGGEQGIMKRESCSQLKLDYDKKEVLAGSEVNPFKKDEIKNSVLMEKERLELERLEKEELDAKLELEREKEIAIAKKKYNIIISHFEKFLDHTVTIIVMTLATVFVLIGDDIDTLSLPPSADDDFDWAKTFCFIIFVIEIIIASFAKKDYVLSFFFWLDVISTISLLQEINFIINPIIYGIMYSFF
jgi:hypothetical protein